MRHAASLPRHGAGRIARTPHRPPYREGSIDCTAIPRSRRLAPPIRLPARSGRFAETPDAHDEFLDIKDDIGRFLPLREYSLVEAEAMVADAIAACATAGSRDCSSTYRMTGISRSTMVERFLIADEWAQPPKGPSSSPGHTREYIHRESSASRRRPRPRVDVFTSETEALGWLSSIRS